MHVKTARLDILYWITAIVENIPTVNFFPQIVGNLIYYRYMNPAIVAPDGFDVVDRLAGSTLKPEQRLILGSISRMLQHAAANKHFPGDGPHIRALNQYISQTHSRFRCEPSPLALLRQLWSHHSL